MEAFINAHNLPTLQDIVEEAKRLNNDKDAYLAILQELVFLNNFNPFAYYEGRLFSFLDKNFSQDKQHTFRQGYGQLLEHHKKALKNAYEMSNIFDTDTSAFMRFALKSLENAYSFSHYPRELLRKLKKGINYKEYQNHKILHKVKL